MLWKCTFRKVIVAGLFAVFIAFGLVAVLRKCERNFSTFSQHLTRKNDFIKENVNDTGVKYRELVESQENMFQTDKKVFRNCPKEFLPNATELPITTKTKGIVYPKVLILTPIKNAESTLKGYFRLLCSLDYPHHLISVAIGEDSSTDNTQQMAEALVKQIQGYFNRVEFYKLDLEFNLPARVTRHSYKWQLPRRRHLAKVRNQLLHRALRDEEWVLWLDSDLVYYKPDLIQHLLSAEKDIVAAACMTKDAPGKYFIYDRNSWRETEASLNFIEGKIPGYLMLEGYYEPTMRIYLPKLGYEGDLVKIDGVGGCALLVRASCHRNGLIFPPFVYKHHIETEGLAKMAEEFKCEVYGMPNYFVIHKS